MKLFKKLWYTIRVWDRYCRIQDHKLREKDPAAYWALKEQQRLSW